MRYSEAKYIIQLLKSRGYEKEGVGIPSYTQVFMNRGYGYDSTKIRVTLPSYELFDTKYYIEPYLDMLQRRSMKQIDLANRKMITDGRVKLQKELRRQLIDALFRQG